MPEERGVGSRPTRGGVVLGALALVFYLLVGWLYLGSGLVMPYPWAYGMWAIWVGGLYVLLRVFRRSPLWTPVVPVAAVVVWVTIVQLGSWLFGWTA